MRKRPTPSAPHFGRLGKSAIRPGVHVEAERDAVAGGRRLVAQRGVGGLRLVQHLDLLAEGLGDGLLGPEVDDALVAVDEDRVAVQRLAGDARRPG